MDGLFQRSIRNSGDGCQGLTACLPIRVIIDAAETAVRPAVYGERLLARIRSRRAGCDAPNGFKAHAANRSTSI